MSLLGDVTLAPTAKVPLWVETFAWAATAMTEPSQLPRQPLDPAKPIPYEDVFLPASTAAYAQCAALRYVNPNLVTESAQRQLQRALIHRLSEICAPSLHDHFVIERMLSTVRSALPSVHETSHAMSNKQYLAFVEKLRRFELKEIFNERPVLARLIGTTILQWIKNTALLIDRIKSDAGIIAENFNLGLDLGPVTDIGWGLSDPHNGGHTVYRLTFSCGLRVGYKPKDLRIDRAWGEFLQWLEARAAPPSAIAPRVVPMVNYGWVEWLEPAPCKSELEASTFFYRAGCLLCLLNVLQGTDFHRENVLAVGHSPVAIDIETLLHPRPFSYLESDFAQKAADLSALDVGYLPAWQTLPDGRELSFGGLSPVGTSNARYLGFREINCDNMEFDVHDAVSIEVVKHVPALHGRPLAVIDYKKEFLQGFSAMYYFLIRQRTNILASNGPIHLFDEVANRIILRPTSVYQKIIDMSLRRQCLVDGIDWSLNFALLPDPVPSSESTIKQLRRAERDSFEQMDIPHFRSKPHDLSLQLSDSTCIEGFFRERSIDRVSDRVKSLSRAELSREVGVVAQAIDASAHRSL